MKIEDILKDWTKQISKRAEKVFYPVSCYQDNSLGFPNKKQIPFEDTIIRKYEHQLFRTRGYRDAGCAAYQIMRFIESFLPKKIDELFWRKEPLVEKYNDFLAYYPKFYGFVRFSFWPGNTE